MKTGWRLVAKLGTDGPHFPHVLADAHGWALRLGPNAHSEMKYFSSLPNLLAGLVEHSIRRRLGAGRPIVSLDALADEIRREIAHARALCQTATHEVEFIARTSRRNAI